jgi:hypothetical protein
MRCVNFKRFERGSLLGFADLAMDSGMVLLGCTYHASNGKRWVNPPGRPQIDADRKLMFDGAGKILYAPTIEFEPKALRFKWSDQAAAAIEAFQQSTTPAMDTGVMNGRAPEAANQGGRRA